MRRTGTNSRAMDSGRVGFVSVTRRRATPLRSPDEFTLANRRAKSLEFAIPRATDAHSDRKNGRLVIDLSSGLAISFRLPMCKDWKKQGHLNWKESRLVLPASAFISQSLMPMCIFPACFRVLLAAKNGCKTRNRSAESRQPLGRKCLRKPRRRSHRGGRKQSEHSCCS
jgi:hypothetical protein